MVDSHWPGVVLAESDVTGVFTIQDPCNGIVLEVQKVNYVTNSLTIGSNTFVKMDRVGEYFKNSKYFITILIKAIISIIYGGYCRVLYVVSINIAITHSKVSDNSCLYQILLLSFVKDISVGSYLKEIVILL